VILAADICCATLTPPDLIDTLRHVLRGMLLSGAVEPRLRNGSWFQQSNLTLLETILLTYGIVYREQAHQLQSEYRFSSHTLADWGMFCKDIMLVFFGAQLCQDRWS